MIEEPEDRKPWHPVLVDGLRYLLADRLRIEPEQGLATLPTRGRDDGEAKPRPGTGFPFYHLHVKISRINGTRRRSGGFSVPAGLPVATRPGGIGKKPGRDGGTALPLAAAWRVLSEISTCAWYTSPRARDAWPSPA